MGEQAKRPAGRNFKDPMMRGQYEALRRAARDNFSPLFFTRTTAGPHPTGPNAPWRGASVRCAYWDGRQGKPSLYARAKGTLGYAAWAAGVDDAKAEASLMPPTLTPSHGGGERPKLTDNQAQVLRNSALRGRWTGSWLWGSQSGTEAIFRALAKKGLAVARGDERVTPCYYTLTDAGMDEAERIAEESGDDIARIRHLRAERDAILKATGGA